MWVATASVACAFAVAGCGGDGDSGGTDSASAKGASSGLSAEAQQAVDAAYKGNFTSPPTSGPKPESGKNIWLVTFGASVVDYKAQGQIIDAAKAMGWKMTLVDGKFDFGAMV